LAIVEKRQSSNGSLLCGSRGKAPSKTLLYPTLPSAIKEYVMSPRTFFLSAALLGIAMFGSSRAAELTAGMQKGTPDLKSAGPITFAPQSILLIGDTKGATVFAIATSDTAAGTPSQPLNIEKIDEKIAGMLGTTPQQILINHLAVNPATGSTFLSVSRGKGPEATPVIMRVDSAGKLGEFALHPADDSLPVCRGG